MARNKRAVISIIISSVIIANISSCSFVMDSKIEDRAYNTPVYVNANDEWWDSAEFSVISDRLSFDNESPDTIVNSKIKSITDDRVYIYHGGYDYVDDDYRRVSDITCVGIGEGEEGRIIGVINLNDHFLTDECFVDNVDGIYDDNGQTYMVITLQYSDSRGRMTYLCTLDCENDSIGDYQIIDIASLNNTDTVSVNNVVFVNDRVFLECYEGDSDYAVYVFDGEEVVRVGLDNIDFVGRFVEYNDSSIIMSVTTFGRETQMLFDVDSYAVSEIDEALCEYTIKANKLIQIDKNGEERTVIDFNHTYLSYNDYSNARVVMVDDDRIIICLGVFDTDYIVLRKKDSNPNAGKQIIKAAYIEQVTAVEAEGIRRYNCDDNDYYVMIDDRYNYWNEFDFSLAEENFELERNRSRSVVIDHLMADIKTGEGPDIVLGGAEYRELQNELYLVDLSSNISDINLSPDAFFVSIINSSEEGGSYYFLPLEVCLMGLMIETDCGYEADGMEFRDYPYFVSEYCAGYDPLYVVQDRMTYFNLLVSSSFDIYDGSNGTVSFDSDEFRDVAIYVSDNVPERIVYNRSDVLCTTLLNIIDDYLIYGDSLADLRVIGFPSPDGRGPSYVATSSISITSCSSCCEGCWELMMELLCDEVQEYSDNIPVNRNAFLKSCNESDTEIQINQTVIDNYIEIINSGDQYYSTYYTIMTILSEEMQAFFVGQKTLDEVIDIIDNRVGLMIEERE